MYKLYISIKPANKIQLKMLLRSLQREQRIGFFLMLIIKSIQLITLQFWTYMGCQEPTCRCQMANLLKPLGLLASSVGTCACIKLSRDKLCYLRQIWMSRGRNGMFALIGQGTPREVFFQKTYAAQQTRSNPSAFNSERKTVPLL